MRENSLNRTIAREAPMPYDLDQFIADCRTALERDPGPRGREEVRSRLERLLANPDFVRKYCGDDAPGGIKILYEDPKLGFQVLSHCYDSPRVSPPHDHGESWAIYGQAGK
jgi:predicted metal-dependent enzyme (double-stranded beta helix superfamily)